MKKLMSILGAMLFVSGVLTSCGGVDACSCISDMEDLVKQSQEADADVEGLTKEMDELAKECEAAAKEDAEGWAKALEGC